MDLTKLTITDLFLYKELIYTIIEDNEGQVDEEELNIKIEKIEAEILARVDSI